MRHEPSLERSAPADRFQMAVQRSRALVYVFAGLLALPFRWLGALDVSYASLGGLVAIAAGSTLPFWIAYRRGWDRWLPFRLEVVWMALDMLLITGGVLVSGGMESPWFLWYLANLSAAAFVVGPAGVLAVTVGNHVCYLGALVLVGDVTGLESAMPPLLRISFLHAAACFFLVGVLQLRQKRTEVRELQLEQAEKLDELMRLTRELAEANVRVREADQMKTRFLANMSHELRTPLNAVIGFSEVLLGPSGEDPEKRERFLSHIHNSGEHLLDIINDLLDLSKLEAGRMEFFPELVSPRDTIHGVVAIMRAVAAKSRIVIEEEIADDLPPFETDPGKLKQILYNLLSNAVKFSPAESRVVVRARALSAAASPLGVPSMQIEVEDRGTGISAEEQEIVFEEFRQSRSRAIEGGTGLGLALVKRFVEQQGGTVELESELGRGSLFGVTLPLQAQVTDARGPLLPPDEMVGDSRLVLVVEDDRLAYEKLGRTLSGAGFVPVRARTGEEALDLARSLRPALVTLDLGLPRLGGWKVLQSLKGDEGTRDIPVVVVSLSEELELGLALGADDYFVKPFSPERLLARLRELVPDAGLSEVTVLVVDDDEVVHESLRSVLEPLGCRTLHARDGASGLRMAIDGDDRPAVVILDLTLPDLTGFEIAERLVENEATADLPVVVLSSRELSSDERAFLQDKIEAFVAKGPHASGRLVSAIRRALQR